MPMMWMMMLAMVAVMIAASDRKRVNPNHQNTKDNYTQTDLQKTTCCSAERLQRSEDDLPDLRPTSSSRQRSSSPSRVFGFRFRRSSLGLGALGSGSPSPLDIVSIRASGPCVP